MKLAHCLADVLLHAGELVLNHRLDRVSHFHSPSVSSRLPSNVSRTRRTASSVLCRLSRGKAWSSPATAASGAGSATGAGVGAGAVGGVACAFAAGAVAAAGAVVGSSAARYAASST